MATLQLPTLDGHVFVPVDVEADMLCDGVDAAGFDRSQRTLFSCVGVTMYLTADSLEASLRTVAGCVPASEIVLSYNVAPPFLDDVGREFLTYVSRTVAETGEPLQTFFSPTDAEALLVRCGLEVAEHPTPEDLRRRYFAGRPDGLRPYTNERLIAAQVL